MVLDITYFNPLILEDKVKAQRLSALLSELVIKIRQRGEWLLWPIFAGGDLVLGSVETLTLNAEWFSSE